MMKRTDLICENGVINDKSKRVFVHNFEICGTKCSKTMLDENNGRIIGKAAGSYYTIFSEKTDCIPCLSAVLKELIPCGSAFVAGLGNARICSDSLGAKALRYIPATAHLAAHADFDILGMRRVTVIETGVTGQTGLESAKQVRFLAEGAGADFVIAIDSLACAESDRLCRTIQLTDTGIAPGAGIGNDRNEISAATIGKKVIAIGVPTVIDYECENGEKMMVAPRNIDRLTDEFARTIGISVSLALNPQLSVDEILSLVV